MKFTVRAIPRPGYKGFARSGRFWPISPVEVDESEITDEMRSEPMLDIRPVVDVPMGTKPSKQTRPQATQNKSGTTRRSPGGK